jgi:hypothetical protein
MYIKVKQYFPDVDQMLYKALVDPDNVILSPPAQPAMT